ncbi:hypothetical protein RHGRI_011657 [Rhododendron griersonianum]|uniref:AMP-dependent synthetase/ligase domain-containing protein n=1 Tax=Rhododendron griersonianum TaxID=479676 RepID=A0AAV6KNW7_9ERIC|nr:hypothetical protein RHGRI_011657 [Rhododendron griersonianum]
MDRPRYNTRSTSGGLEVRGRGRAAPSARGRGHATPTVLGRERAIPAARGRGCANPVGRGRGSAEAKVFDDTVDTENKANLADPAADPTDPITKIIVNSGAPTGSIDPVVAVQAFQYFMGLFAGHQAQVTPANATRSLTLDKGNTFNRFLKTNPPPFMGTDKLSDAEAWLLQMEKIFDVLGCSEAQKGQGIREKRLSPYERITYGEAYDSALRMGSAVWSRGVNPGDRCGIYGSNCPEWIISMEGLEKEKHRTMPSVLPVVSLTIPLAPYLTSFCGVGSSSHRLKRLEKGDRRADNVRAAVAFSDSE